MAGVLGAQGDWSLAPEAEQTSTDFSPESSDSILRPLLGRMIFAFHKVHSAAERSSAVRTLGSGLLTVLQVHGGEGLWLLCSPLSQAQTLVYHERYQLYVLNVCVPKFI